MSWDISPNALGLHSFAWQVVAVARKMARNLADQDICQERHLIKYTIYGLLPRQNVRWWRHLVVHWTAERTWDKCARLSSNNHCPRSLSSTVISATSAQSSAHWNAWPCIYAQYPLPPNNDLMAFRVNYMLHLLSHNLIRWFYANIRTNVVYE